MDFDGRAEQIHWERSLVWAHDFNQVRGPGMARWVSTFRSNVPCQVVDDHCGAFNWSCQVRFEDGLQWMARFAIPGRVINGDEKVPCEVATMQFLKANTRIPVPSVIAWGTSADNPLVGLGAFIIMEFIEGQSLGELWEMNPPPESGQILKADISDRDLDIIYRQMVNIMLELSEHEFSHIGALSPVDNTYTVDSRPVTWKMNEILHHGAVDVGAGASRPFSSTRDYFSFVADQQLQHLREQQNSVKNEADARDKYLRCRTFKAMIPYFVTARHDRGPFKLICDDFKLGDILVNNAQDLQIVAILDWEWAYAAPYQMLYSPPRWLLIKKPITWDTGDRPLASFLSKYQAQFQKFVQILEEEEDKRARDAGVAPWEVEKMSALMRQSMEDGKFWFHELVYSSFESPANIAWAAIRELLPHVDELATASAPETEAFVKEKMEHLRQYEVEWTPILKEMDRKKAEIQARLEKIQREEAARRIEI